MAIITRMPFLFLLPLAAWAGRSADYSIDPIVIDGGGTAASSTAYTINASIAPGTAGASAHYALRSGYAGQLLDLAGIAIDEPSSPMTIHESGTLQLTVSLIYDDATKSVLSANDLIWSVPSGPLAGIDSSGLATAGLVYQDTSALVQVVWGSFSDRLNLTVLETIPNNFGRYAADGLPDDWQAQYFGSNGLNAGPNDNFDGDGLTNLQEFAFGTNPTETSTGSLSYAAGFISQRGLPAVSLRNITGGVDFRASFIRRKNHLAVGLTYQVQFSGDLTTWQSSTATPTIVASDAETEAVTVPYPLFVNGKKARFFRVAVSQP
jgi:hypothetical protein